MTSMLKIARIYDTRALPVATLHDVIRLAEGLARSMRSSTTRRSAWWPWSSPPSSGEALMVMDACTKASNAGDLSVAEASFVRLLVFHRLYGGPAADQLHAFLDIAHGFVPAPTLSSRPRRQPVAPVLCAVDDETNKGGGDKQIAA